DELFATIAPKLLQEAEEKDLTAEINGFLGGEYYDDNFNTLVEAAQSLLKTRKALTIDDFRNPHAQIISDDFGTILVQLSALGLIKRSERKRSVSDTGTYWALTPYGESRTIHLRAIKKSSVAAS